MIQSSVIDTRQFRHALGTFATGVTIVTTRNEAGSDVGLTANSFNSVSLEPPMVLWSLARRSHSLPAFMAAEYFAVHILAADQEPLSNRFAQRSDEKFVGLMTERGHGHVPLLNGCAARFECRTAYRHEGGDHVIFVGEVLTFENFDRPPLVFQGGRYAMAVHKPASEVQLSGLDEVDGSFSHDSLRYLMGIAHAQLSMKLRTEIARHALQYDEYAVLEGLVEQVDCTTAALDARVAGTGLRVTPALLASLQERKFIHLAPDDAVAWQARQVHLTDHGRQTMIELAAIAKAAEADAQSSLDDAERQMLKHLMRRIIRDSNPLPG